MKTLRERLTEQIDEMIDDEFGDYDLAAVLASDLVLGQQCVSVGLLNRDADDEDDGTNHGDE